MKNLIDTIAEISAGMKFIDNLAEKCAYGDYSFSDDEQAELRKINIEGLRFFKKFQSFTGVTDEDLKY